MIDALTPEERYYFLCLTAGEAVPGNILHACIERLCAALRESEAGAAAMRRYIDRFHEPRCLCAETECPGCEDLSERNRVLKPDAGQALLKAMAEKDAKLSKAEKALKKRGMDYGDIAGQIAKLCSEIEQWQEKHLALTIAASEKDAEIDRLKNECARKERWLRDTKNNFHDWKKRAEKAEAALAEAKKDLAAERLSRPEKAELQHALAREKEISADIQDRFNKLTMEVLKTGQETKEVLLRAEADILREKERADRVDPERVAQLIAHRACSGNEHDGLGKQHGSCVVCITPWPCEYAGKPPDIRQPAPPDQEKKP